MMDKKRIIKDTLTLVIITLISGGLLGYVYDLTKQPIENQEIKVQNAAYHQVTENCDSFKEAFANEIEQSKKQLSNYGTKGIEIINALTAYQNDMIQGYIIHLVSHDGYNGDIELIIGFDKTGIITGIEILTINETPGLGMKATNEDFLNQYLGHKVSKFIVTKESHNDNEIDALSSATITTNAINDGINGALEFYTLYIQEDS